MSARSAASDYLRVNPFWLFEIPKLSNSGFVPMLNPLAGFSSIVAPEISLETQEIADGTALFNKTVVKRATLSTVTLMRGAKFTDQDFWRWTARALTGTRRGALNTQTPRRDLVLVHFLSSNSKDLDTGLSTFGGMISFESIRVPARVFVLKNTIPVRYKTGGDFDAASGDISLQELELALDDMVQVSLGATTDTLQGGIA